MTKAPKFRKSEIPELHSLDVLPTSYN